MNDSIERAVVYVGILFLVAALLIFIAELRTGKQDKNLRLRYLSALVLVPLALSAVYFGGLLFEIFVFLLSVLCTREFMILVGVWQHQAYRLVTIFSLLILVVASVLDTLQRSSGFHPFYAVLVPLIMIVLSVPIFLRSYQGMVLRELTTIFALLYFGWFSAHLILLRNLEGGLGLTTFLLVVVAVNDVSAYGAGRLFGAHRLIAEISPKKTWEGFFGGMVGSVVASLSFSFLAPQLSVTSVLMAGFLIAVTAPFGDLVVSVIKRDMNKKDSGDIIPGHGGLLDRTDSLIFSAPNFYYFVFLVESCFK